MRTRGLLYPNSFVIIILLLLYQSIQIYSEDVWYANVGILCAARFTSAVLDKLKIKYK